MASDPRKFLVKQCGSTQSKKVGEDAKRKDFFNSLGKVGDIELLNNSALGGKVGKGLRDLTRVSNSIRVGGNPSSAIPQNGSDVLIATGISQASQAQAGTFNPGVLNKATAAADQIADQVKGGQFSLSNIPNSFTDIQNLSTLVDGIFTNGGQPEEKIEVCQASPYAMDLIAYAPKYRFLFIMEFEFTAPYAEAMGNQPMAFVVKNSTRPNINFEHEEVNMYNFWVRVPKRTSYEPMTMRFYDDNKNWAMRLYTAYLKAVSPIANIAFGAKMEDRPQAFEAQSMNFQSYGTNPVSGGADTFGGHPYAASFGPMADASTKNVFKRITLHHVYQSGKVMNSYRFFNPKILSMELDEVDSAENGNGSEMTVQFAYDAVSIALGVKVKGAGLEAKTDMGKYPLDPVFKGDEEFDQLPEDPDDGGGFFSNVGSAVGSVTGAVSGAIDFGTGLVSDAFTATSNFAGSVFSDFSAGVSAAESSVKNSINGDVPSDK